MDLKLLEKIFQIPARSHQEKEISEFIKNELDKNKINYFIDKIGNISSVEKKGVPILCAHMDTVQDEFDAKLSKFVKIRGEIISGYGVIGGDDKCGIFIVLSLACAGFCNFLFTVEEECGGNGIKHFTKNYSLENIPYGLVLDRRGCSDIICTSNNYGAEPFEKILLEIGKVFGYSKSSGTFSDANFLSDQISCANLSVGYYNPHSKKEFVNLVDLKNALNFTYQIIKNVKDYFPKPKPSYSNYSSYYGADDDNNYLTQICAFCNETKTKTLYMKTVKDFVCSDCMKELFSELIEKEEFIITNAKDDVDETGQMPIGFDENFEEEHHSSPNENTDKTAEVLDEVINSQIEETKNI